MWVPIHEKKGTQNNKGVKNIPGKRRKTISSNQKRIKNNRGKINSKKSRFLEIPLIYSTFNPLYKVSIFFFSF